MSEQRFVDPGAERALLGLVSKHGRDVFVDVSSGVTKDDFSIGINRVIWAALQDLADDQACERFDAEAIKLKATARGHSFTTKELEYLELLPEVGASAANATMFALRIKKFSVLRDLHGSYKSTLGYIESLSGNEQLSDILRESETRVLNFVHGLDQQDSLSVLAEDLSLLIESRLQDAPVEQVGLPTGFPQWDKAIGGGVRMGTVPLISARPKVGKSMMAMNMAHNLATLVVDGKPLPVFYGDTELTKDYQQARLLCIRSGCPILSFETGKFQRDKILVGKVRQAAAELKGLNICHETLAGKSYPEWLAAIRRWIVRKVGFREDGKANPCAVIIDYVKLTSDASLTSHSPEWIILGLMLTAFHDFALKYNIPMICFSQTNREGIDSDATNIIAGSDRLLWLCSNFSVLRNKGEEDKNMGCGWEQGNKKLLVVETRHGPGLTSEYDYINLHASMRPQIDETIACGRITEGITLGSIQKLGT